jgi:HSP20 family protein
MDSKEMTPWERAFPIFRRGGNDPFLALQREINRLFDDTSGWHGGLLASLPAKWPRLDFSEADGAYTVTAELPGMEEKDVEVAISGDILTIKGEKRTEKKDEKKHIEETYHGSFERRLTVPDDIDQDKLKATFKNGVLTLTMPKLPAAASAAKRIPVTAG